MKLRPYQKRDVQSILQMVSKNQHSAYVLPTGGGKTLVVGYVILSLIKEYKRIMFSVPRVSLITQTIKVFKGLGINCGEKHDNNQVIVICNYSVKRYINKIKPDFIIFDEAHIAIHMQEEIMKKRNCKVLGITATPECLRSREKILKFSDVYSKKHFGPNINELTKTGHLVPVQAKYYNFDDDEISLNASGDFNGKEAFDSIQKQGTVVKVAKEINKHPEQKHILIFTISLAAVKEITKYLNKKCGGGFVGVTSKDYEYGRGKKKLGRYKLHEQIYDDFEAGKIRGIVNCNLINFGWDKPCVDTIYQLRPTMSKALYLQMIGRGLRPDTNKKFVRLYDMVGNIKRFNENGVPLYEVGDIKWENDKINKRRFP
ncbi:hypothetical protein FACS189485_20910 [Spirochaetia bacterium]|nr:hypothetical protein FACS189485_20910 [Spirochaetia bacterium]